MSKTKNKTHNVIHLNDPLDPLCDRFMISEKFRNHVVTIVINYNVAI